MRPWNWKVCHARLFYLFLILLIIFFTVVEGGNKKNKKKKAAKQRQKEQKEQKNRTTAELFIPKHKGWKPLKVLVVAQTRAYSHFQLNVRFAEILAQRGHDVVCLFWQSNANRQVHTLYTRFQNCMSKIQLIARYQKKREFVILLI